MMDAPEKMFAAIVYGGGAAMLVLALALVPMFVPPVGGTVVRYPEFPCPQYTPAAPPGISPPPCTDGPHGWEFGRMSDVAKDCLKPGIGRPWCR